MRFPKLNAARIIHGTLVWSKAFVPVLAILAAVASSIRTVQATAEIYTASGSNPFFVAVAAFAFTTSVEGALFALALAQENQQIKWRTAHKKRHVTTLRTIARSINVRIGRAEPLTYDQMPESDGGLNTLIFVAFLFAIASNMYLGLKPLTNQIGSSTLQSFVGRILNADAHLQLSFILDLAGVFFPPFMALKAGHLTARFASEVMASQMRSNAKVQREAKRTTEQASKSVQSGATERLIEHLNSNPDDRNLSQHQLAKKVGVSVGTVNKVVNYSNGHGEKQLASDH